MLKRNGRLAGPRVTMVDDAELDFRMTTRGERQAGQPCQLTLAVNGGEPVSFLEEAGARAPLSVVVDVSMPLEPGRAVLDALSTRPWLHADAPVIVYARGDAVAARRGVADESPIAYLVRNHPIDELIRLIRDTLDLAPHGS